jgi:VanZ family protein
MTTTERSHRRAKRAAFFWGLLLITLTSWPRPPAIPVVSSIPDFDKVIHALLYGVEAFLLYRAIRWRDRPGFSLPRVLAIVGIMAVWGVLDEVHQYWIPGRSVEATDVMADVIGATVGALAASIAQARPGGRGKPLPYGP